MRIIRIGIVFVMLFVLIKAGLSYGSVSGIFDSSENKARIFESIKTVSISYKKQSQIYKRAHKACQEFFSKATAKTEGEPRASFSVEVLSVLPQLKKASALCVARKYKNDDVVAFVK